MHHYSLFDTFFRPPTILVVSEERLKQAEREQKRKQLESVDVRLTELREYRQELAKELDKLEEPQSLEEALTGE
ncbi:hypothetical protein CYIG_00027 [Cyanophage NATL1A-7]|jgi:hypothetical protein|uniref:Predicted protein n=1 Tax=Cyanophage NATL1A-7 TaxID=445693 RepID=E3SN97_9CAUD|nr:hypothetical protein CYIG_00027 [Cyanophage NATL1A-7]ADP00101.1 predicted protein [Cyanophage NATL1A-7]|tara:strand:+ start:64 stop:285 length:222 start_codon:yes stop_codon:yes gene_type:complete